MSPTEISNRVWSLSHVLRDDGIVFHKYLSELTYLLFLKIADEKGISSSLPKGCDWATLAKHPTKSIVGRYRKMLTSLGEDSDDLIVREIFGFPTTVFSHDENLKKVVTEIASIDWRQASGDGFGQIYEALLERNASESRSGAGQYFTPRPLVDCMVKLVNPQPGEIIQDPSTGTGGFMISANEFMHRSPAPRKRAKDRPNFEGVEIERDTYRLCLMNFYLHGIEGRLIHGDALTADALALSKADLILANPPFGSAAGGARARRTDLPYQTSNKQLMFLQHIMQSLKPGGRAAVVVPDNVLFEDGVGRKIRVDLMAKCNLHTILRLPQGIFYAQGVNTNVLFFESGTPTDRVWFYDLRTNQKRFNKGNPLTIEAFETFIEAYGDPKKANRGKKKASQDDRFKSFSRHELSKRGDSLDITWLPDARSARHEIDDIQTAIAEIREGIGLALKELESVEKAMLEE